MKTQAYTFLGTSLFIIMLSVTIIFPPKAFAQTFNNAATDPIFIENITSPELFGHTLTLLRTADTSSSEKNEKIESLRKKIRNNLNILKRVKRNYSFYKDYLNKLKKYKDMMILDLTMHYRDKINRGEMSYDPKILTETIKSLTSSLDQYKFRVQDSVLKIKKEIDRLEKGNARLEKKLTVLLANTTNKSYTAEEPDNYYRAKCPKRNPGDPKIPNRKRYKFDTNNNPNDGNYILCGYRKNGEIEFEIPHANNKKHGISYYYISVPYHAIKTVIPYTDGKKDGVMTSFMQAKDGHRYKWSESEFSEGIITKKMMWREDGSLKNVSTYSGGRKNHECFINKDGSERCVKY